MIVCLLRRKKAKETEVARAADKETNDLIGRYKSKLKEAGTLGDKLRTLQQQLKTHLGHSAHQFSIRFTHIRNHIFVYVLESEVLLQTMCLI